MNNEIIRSMEEENRQKNWVDLRAACTIESVFKELVETIQSDIDRFNALCGCKFSLKRVSSEEVHISTDSEKVQSLFVDHKICLNINSTGIWISEQHHSNCLWKTKFEISLKWNSETLVCDLLIEEKPYTIWQISQKAIGDFLFDNRL